MTDQIRPPAAVTRLTTTEAAETSRLLPLTGTEHAAPERHAEAAGMHVETKPGAETKTPAPKPAASPDAARNVRLHFKIDPDTNDVTVFMVDTASRRVIRTIPPEEFKQLDEGELVELLA
mgnify:CR=1 FL=1